MGQLFHSGLEIQGGELAVLVENLASHHGHGQFPTIDLNAAVGEMMEYALPRVLATNKEEA